MMIGNWSAESLKRAKVLFLTLVILGFGFRIGYGVARYRGNIFHLSGEPFINHWNHDPYYHVLIAKALLSGQGYVVYDAAGQGRTAIFKAPLYQYFLAGVFALSGFSFKLYFPLQSLLGGLTAGLAGLISYRTFRMATVAWFAGLGAAVHPILVNSASQPYNENLFFFFFMAAIWTFLVWLDSLRLYWAALCGAMIGLCMLTRENGSILLVAILITILLTKTVPLRAGSAYALIVVTTFAIVGPWTFRNYQRFHAFIPVASIVATDFIEGNNECVAKESIFVPVWSEGACPEATQQVRAVLANQSFDPRAPAVVRVDQASKRVAINFVRDHWPSYVKLSIRRFWTTLLPFSPRGRQSWSERLALTLYWMIVFPAGFAGIVKCLKPPLESRSLFLLSLILLNIASIAAVLYWSDLRFRVGIDLLLCCFAGFTYDHLVDRGSRRETVLSRTAEA